MSLLKITVRTLHGAAPGELRSAVFDASGGTIGRATTNTMVLDDPERTVSRVHAQVLCRDGQFLVVDRGSNPLLCNGRALGTGNEAPLSHEDRLTIGGFELVAELQQANATPVTALPAAAAAVPDDDPFADLLAGLGAPAPVVAPAARGANPLESGSSSARGHSSAVDPFADLLGPSLSAASSGAAALDDFSDLGAPPAHGKAAGIDDLFGGVGSGGGIGGDPLALSPLADPLLQPNTASADDPLAALQRAAPATPTPHADHLPIEKFGFTPPRAVAPPPPPASAPSLAQALPQFDDMTGQPIRISGPEVASKPNEPPAAPVPPPAPAYAASPVHRASPPAERTASDDELLAAFLRGLASTHQPPEMLTPGLMERIGSMLRSATEGTLQLLLTRQEFKREVRAEVTMIAAQANNPLKFSPTVEVALAHLLGPGVRGFMPPEAAMRDAFNDLRAHQFGVMVGMRAALAHVIGRFEPAELEKKISAKSALDALFSANRKAKLWDQFVSLYGGIASEAEDDFHSLFGKAFLEAYEEQMARLKHNDNNSNNNNS
ncbi:type VI secretion system-associated FHA domain protein TagH [Variovorax paradoxus]|nr:type VI secretion system-associated FHA domain protein TagH [Variovorax paradoxus]